jgi:hypothetical protein
LFSAPKTETVIKALDKKAAKKWAKEVLKRIGGRSAAGYGELTIVENNKAVRKQYNHSDKLEEDLKKVVNGTLRILG